MFGSISGDVDTAPAMSVVIDSGNAQSVSTMSSVYTNMFRTVERLVDVQERQIEQQQQQLEVIGKGFDRLVQCISGFSVQSACWLPLLSTSDNVASKNGSPPRISAPMITITHLRPDNTKTDRCVPLASELFNLFGGKQRKTEHGPPQVTLIDLILCSVWRTFQSESERIVIPFLLEWDSESSDTDLFKRWQNQCEHWIYTDDRTLWKRNVYTAFVAADGKPCLVVYFKKMMGK